MSGTEEVERAFVRRPLLGRSLLRGSVFKPFSWRALLVILTPESCKEKKNMGSRSSPYLHKVGRTTGVLTETAWRECYTLLDSVFPCVCMFVCVQAHEEAKGDPWVSSSITLHVIF